MVYVVRTLPTQHMLGTLGQHTLEAHAGHYGTDLIVVDQARVTEHLGGFAKHLFHLVALAHHFFLEAIFVGQRRQAMGIRFCQEFAAAGVVQLMQEVQNGRSINLQLFQCHTRDGEGDFKSSSRIFDHFQQSCQCRNIRMFGHITDTGFIGVVIIIIVVSANVEETITFQVNNLVYFKIKTNRSHFLFLFCYLP